MTLYAIEPTAEEVNRAIREVPFAPESSEWWIQRMSIALFARIPRFKKLEDYYRGEQKLRRLAMRSWFESKLSRAFPNYLHANHSKLIVNAAANRLVVLGFRMPGEFRADDNAARIWRRNEMDAESDRIHIEALVKGECPVLVEPDPQSPDTPVITGHDPTQMIVWHAPSDRRIRLAGLKTWWDADEQRRRYILYLPDSIERWHDTATSQRDKWGEQMPKLRRGDIEPRNEPGQEWKTTNPLGKVPIIVVGNESRLAASPEGEHEPVINRIDHYNMTLMEMAVTTHELAFPQRWATGVDADSEPTPPPVTIPLDEDETDVETARPTVQSGQTRWITTPTPDAEFGQFVAATVDNYVKALDQIRADIATDTFTPYHFLLNMPSSVPPSGESLTAAEAPLVDKVRGHARDKGPAWRQVMALAFEVAGRKAEAIALRDAGATIWQDPERRTESQHVDALGKMVQMLGLPQEAAWELLPASPEQINRWNQMEKENPAPTPQIGANTAVPDGQPSTGTTDQPLQ